MTHYKTIIFCDFDGTITTEETFVGTLMQVCEKKDLYEWFGKYQRKEITIRACTEKLFSLAPSANWPKVEAYAASVGFRPGFSAFLDRAAALSVPVVVISGGVGIMQKKMLAPYMDRILAFYSCDLDLSGTYMRFSCPYASSEENMDKAAIMDLFDYDRAVCIGDHTVDIHMAEHSDVVFARDLLAGYMDGEGLAYHPWETFDDIAEILPAVV